MGIDPDGTFQATCLSCSRMYRVVHGRLSERSSIQEAVLYLTSKLPSLYKRHYEFRITTPARDLKLLKFSIAGRVDQVPVRRGDMVSVLYSSRGYILKKLISITNHTTGRDYVLPSPALGYTYLLTSRGSLAAMVCLSTLYLSFGQFLITLPVLVLSGYLYLKLIHAAQLTNPPLRMDVQEEVRLMTDQELLGQKHRLEQRVSELKYECHTNKTLIRQLQALSEKMLSFDRTLYSFRVNRIDRAVTILRQQMTNAKGLVAEYNKTLQMIEIEVETSKIAAQLPDAEEFMTMILGRLEELKAIEHQNQQLKFQLEANEEVRRLRA